MALLKWFCMAFLKSGQPYLHHFKRVFWLRGHAHLNHFKRLSWFFLKRQKALRHTHLSVISLMCYMWKETHISRLNTFPTWTETCGTHDRDRDFECVCLTETHTFKRLSWFFSKGSLGSSHIQNLCVCLTETHTSQRLCWFFLKRQRERCFDFQDSPTCIISKKAIRAVFISKEPYKIISKEPYIHLHPDVLHAPLLLSLHIQPVALGRSSHGPATVCRIGKIMGLFYRIASPL